MTNPAQRDQSRRMSRGLWAALAVYSVLLALLSLRHEMWRDEVRALSVATAGSWREMFASLHFEGHPSLWYILLRAGYGVSHSNLVLPILAIVIAIATAYVILRYAPFPFWLRACAIFGVFLGYELSVVARNYGIAVLLLMLACTVYPARANRGLLLGFLLALMANTSVHAAAAALVVIVVWLTDFVDPVMRRQVKSPAVIGGSAIAIAGVVISVVTAWPHPEMAWATSLSTLDAAEVLRKIFADPGRSLLGFGQANVAAVDQLPWRRIGVDAETASRVIVDICFVWLFWFVRRSWRAIVAILISIIGFAFLFRSAYTAGLRHEGILLFLIFAICWMVAERESGLTRSFAIGLLPLFAFQTLAFPVVAQRVIRSPESSSKSYAAFIDRNPEYREAILMGEPDYMMEALPYYVTNRVYMPRQHEFSRVVFFDRGSRRQLALSLPELMHIADSVSCSAKKPVLLAVQYDSFFWGKGGVEHPNYKGSSFTWTLAQRDSLLSRQPAGAPIAIFGNTTSDEFYSVYEMRPRTCSF